MIASFLIAAVVGVVIGVFSGLLGVGGGTIMVPVFRLVFDMAPLASTATSLFTIIPTSISGAVSHVRGKTCVPKLGIAMGIGGACTSWAGVWLAQVSPGWMVMAAAAVIIGWSAYTMLRKALAAPRGAKRGAGPENGPSEAAPALAPVAPPDLSGRRLFQGALIGAAAGVASGYVGLGGGFLMVPLMAALLNMPMKLTSGTSLVAILILALPATVAQCALGNVDYLVGIAVACGSIPGAVTGAKLVSRMPERALRFAFAAFLAVAAVLLVLKELG